MVCLCVSLLDVLDSMARFSVQGVFNYSMLTLSDHERVLYVGAREALFALDPNDISRQLRPQVTHTHTHNTLYYALLYSTSEGDLNLQMFIMDKEGFQEKQLYPQHCLTVAANTHTFWKAFVEVQEIKW